MFDKPNYCKKIEGQMVAMKINIKEIAKKSGYSTPTVSRVIHGESASIRLLSNILDVLGLELTVRAKK